MEPQSGDTIVAIATAPGRGAIGVVRVSGPAAPSIAVTVAGRLPTPRIATRAAFLDGAGRCLDDGLVLFFPGPQSYSGDDLVEFQGHGSPVVLASLLDRCVELGARLANPGEFTRRAFLNGKLALSEAEAVADIIEARSLEAARAGVRALRGELSSRIASIDRKLLDLRALVETSLDFPEEYPEVAVAEQVQQDIGELLISLHDVLAAAKRGRLLRDGASVVFFGAPNAGKSSLFNCLAGEDIAIVTAFPGTTRDVLRAEVVIEGVLFRLFDTAGLRDAVDPVEQVGMERALAAAAQADVIVHVEGPQQLNHVAIAHVTRLAEEGVAVLRVRSKCDLDACFRTGVFDDQVGRIDVSVRTGSGIRELRGELLRAVGWMEGQGDEGVFAAQARHVDSLERASNALVEAMHVDGRSSELVADELRCAHDAVGEISGRTLADDLLGEIFARFCLGK